MHCNSVNDFGYGFRSGSQYNPNKAAEHVNSAAVNADRAHARCWQLRTAAKGPDRLDH